MADSIADAAAADKAARIAADIAIRANRAKDEAAAAECLRQGLDRVAADATAAHARACIEAMRAGKGIPACPTTLPTVDSAPYAAAMAHLAALDRAADAARAAAARVAALADEIMFGESRVLADEAAAAIELYWRLVDQIKGLIMIDEARPGGPRFRDFQKQSWSASTGRTLGRVAGGRGIRRVN